MVSSPLSASSVLTDSDAFHAKLAGDDLVYVMLIISDDPLQILPP